MSDIGDAAYRERGESESFWRGAAGDACRADLTTEGEDSDTLRRLMDKTQQALHTFADRIDTVRSRMDQARQVATKGELIVAPTAILPPGPGPGPTPTHPIGPMQPEAEQQFAQQAAAHQADVAAYQTKMATFAEVATTIADARTMQEEAHRALDAAMQDPLADVKAMKTWSMFAAGTAIGYVKGVQTTANDLFKTAGEYKAAASTMQARAESMTSSTAMRELAERAAERGRTVADATYSQYARTQKMNSAIPERARQFIEKNPGNYIKSGNGWLKLGKGAARGVPFFGTGISIISGGVDVALGRDPRVVAVETGANIGGGVVGGMSGAAIGSAIFPGPGTVIGGVIGGVIGSMSAVKGVDEAMGVEE